MPLKQKPNGTLIIDPEKLRKLYEDDEMCVTQIARELGCSAPLISDRLHELGIRKMPVLPSEVSETPLGVVALDEAGMTPLEISKTLECPLSTVIYTLRNIDG